MSEIKAIPTRYNGYHFRSRLEARWAVFFDQLGVKYLYEEEGYRLEDGELYLPDFRLPRAAMVIVGAGGIDEMTRTEEVSVFVEVKPRNAPAGGLKKVIKFIKQCRTFVFISHGDPYEMLMQGVAYTEETLYCVSPAALVGVMDGCPMFATQGKNCEDGTFRDFVSGCSDGFASAATAARSARFEHGESGPT